MLHSICCQAEAPHFCVINDIRAIPGGEGADEQAFDGDA